MFCWQVSGFGRTNRYTLHAADALLGIDDAAIRLVDGLYRADRGTQSAIDAAVAGYGYAAAMYFFVGPMARYGGLGGLCTDYLSAKIHKLLYIGSIGTCMSKLTEDTMFGYRSNGSEYLKTLFFYGIFHFYQCIFEGAVTINGYQDAWGLLRCNTSESFNGQGRHSACIDRHGYDGYVV